MKTCPQCGLPIDSEALRFLHERYHAGAIFGLRHQEHKVLTMYTDELLRLLQEYADWCFAEMDGSADDLRQEE